MLREMVVVTDDRRQTAQQVLLGMGSYFAFVNPPIHKFDLGLRSCHKMTMLFVERLVVKAKGCREVLSDKLK